MAKTIAIIGGGIVGLSHAWAAARSGARVLLFERSTIASGASVRNFGMVWPIGQPRGAWHQIALRSRQLWLEILSEAQIWYDPSGSFHLAYRPDEREVLEEFLSTAPASGYDCRWLDKSDVLDRSRAAQPRGLLGGMWSPTEVCVDPRRVTRELPKYLADRWGVELHYGTGIESVAPTSVTASDGRQWGVDGVIVASGAELRSLYSDVLESAGGFRLCKLQMLRTTPQPQGWRMGPMLAGGLTLRHYPTFRHCQSLETLKRRIATESPLLDQYGIHVMASQTADGEITLGDSHEYDAAIEPFDKELINDLMLAELRGLIRLPDFAIAQRWHGIYASRTEAPMFLHEPEEGVLLAISTGGCGMTMSFGLAEQNIASWLGSQKVHKTAVAPAI